MRNQIPVAIGVIAVAISIPLVALAFVPGQTPVPSSATSTEVDAMQTSGPADVAPRVEEQTMARQQLRVHAETGPPEGFEPTRQRLHQGERTAEGTQAMKRNQNRIDNDDAPMGHDASAGHHGNKESTSKGNHDVSAGDGTGECRNEDGSTGSGPHGPGNKNNG